jgi:hypothetical protein
MFHGPTGRKTENDMRIGPEIVSDDARDERSGSGFARLNNYFHTQDLTTNGH